MAKKALVERSAAAVDLGRLRWKNTSKAQRVAHGRLMAKARWDRVKDAPKKTA